MPRKTNQKANKLPNLLLTVARKKATEYRVPNGKAHWFATLSQQQPTTAKELMQLARDWNAGGETRELFPAMADFHRFVIANVTKVNRCSFNSWVHSLSEDNHGAN